MNKPIPTLKVGQRFLSILQGNEEITEVTVKQVAPNEAYIKCFWRYFVPSQRIHDERTEWLDINKITILCVLDDPSGAVPSTDAAKHKKEIAEMLVGTADMEKDMERLSKIPLTMPSSRPPFSRDTMQDLQRFGKDTVFSVNAKKVQHNGNQWYIRAVIEASVNGKLKWCAIESSTADDDSPEIVQNKITEAVNHIPRMFSDLFNQAKPTTATGLDPAWTKGDKSVTVTAEVTADGIKFTNTKES